MSDLIERLRAHAALHRGLGVDDYDEQAQWARDLLTAVDEIERLTAALRAQPGPVSMDDMEWAGKVHLAEAIRERDEHARWRADLADKLHDRETTISAAWEALRSAGVHSEATIDDGIRLLRRQLAEAQKELHNLNWALGTEGYDQMATPEEQAEHEAAVRAHHDVLARLEEGKRAYEAMKRDAECWHELDRMMGDPDARLNVNAGGWAVLKCGLLGKLGASDE